MTPRPSLVALPLLLILTARCEQPNVAPPAPPTPASLRTQALVGDGKLQPGEQCDDGNTQGNDGCSSTGTLEAGFLCHIPGQACSQASLCGNITLDSGEACEDANTADDGNGCTGACDLSQCGNGAFDNMSYPSFSQEICDDGNRFDGDGCSRLCVVEPRFACVGFPSRCVSSGVEFFNTGVDANHRRLASGPDPHWFYASTVTGADTTDRLRAGWPWELQTARFMAAQGTSNCVYQDFLLPPNINTSAFRLRLAVFNDNAFSAASVNRFPVTPTIISQPPGEPWQKNIILEFGPPAPWQPGLNRIELCTQVDGRPPDGFRYLFVDAYDDRCGDRVVDLPREECDDGNTTSSDGCSASCGIEGGYGCYGQPSQCNAGCGDGALGEGEQCDDGNDIAGDGCGVHCTIEAGYSCTGFPSVCTVVCGDGIKALTEACDDGNTSDGDGCSAACTLEAGFSCQTAPVSVFFTRRGRTDCTQVTSVSSPALSYPVAQATLRTPGRYRIQYVSGAINFSAGSNWRPGIIGVNFTSRQGPGAFSLGINPPYTGLPSREQAMRLGFGLMRDFEAASGEVRLAAIDNDCFRDDNSNTTITYRVDALPICQQVPVIATPTQRAVVDATPDLSGSAEPGSQVTVYEDSVLLCAATTTATGAWNCTPSQPFPSGPHSVIAIATDAKFNVSLPSALRVFTVDTTPPPAPTVTEPHSDQALSTPSPSIRGTAEPDSTVVVHLDGVVAKPTRADAQGQWNVTPSTALADGPHRVVAVATDAVGNDSLESGERAFTVDTVRPPAPVVTAPGARVNTQKPVIAGTAEAGTTVKVWLGDGEAPIGTTEADAAGNWRFDPPTPLDVGVHTVSVIAMDAAGNSSERTQHEFAFQKSHYGWSCTTATASSAAWALLALALSLRKRYAYRQDRGHVEGEGRSGGAAEGC